MKILVGKATLEISSEGPDVSLGTELVAYCTHLLHLKLQQRILKRCESVNDEDNIGGDSTPELLRVNHLRHHHREHVGDGVGLSDIRTRLRLKARPLEPAALQ